MKINNALLNGILISIFIFPIIFKFREFYLVSFLAIPFIIYNMFKYKVKISKRNMFKILILLISIYSIYILVLTLYIDKNYFLYSFNKCITLYLFIAFIIYLSNKNDISNFMDVIMKLIVITSFISILLYFVGIDGINLTLKPKVITDVLDFKYYGERRISWLYEHKIQFSATCLIGSFFVANNSKIGKVKKVIYQIILMIAIILSNSKMALPLVVVIIIVTILKSLFYNMKKIKSSKELFFKWLKSFVIIISLILCINILNNILNNISNTRDISTLGKRTIIWSLAIEDIKENKVGIIKTYGKTLNNGWSMYSTGHNQILNEFLETGIVGGILITSIMLITLFLIKGVYYKIIYLILVILGQFDFLITGIFGYIFWIFTAILVVNSYKVGRLKDEKVY